jgi:hypothetical protein
LEEDPEKMIRRAVDWVFISLFSPNFFTIHLYFRLTTVFLILATKAPLALYGILHKLLRITICNIIYLFLVRGQNASVTYVRLSYICFAEQTAGEVALLSHSIPSSAVKTVDVSKLDLLTKMHALNMNLLAANNFYYFSNSIFSS